MSILLLPCGGDGQSFIDSTGAPRSGAKMFIYLAGTSTKATLYQDKAGAANHTNPIVLNSSGQVANGSGVVKPIFVDSGSDYDVVLAPSNDTDPPVSPYFTLEDIEPVNDATATATDQWTLGGTPTYVSATSLTLAGDVTSTYHVGRRIKTTNSGGTIYSTITVSAYTTLTTLTVVNDSGTLDAGLSDIYYSILTATGPAIPGVEISGSDWTHQGKVTHEDQGVFSEHTTFSKGLGPNYKNNTRITASVSGNAILIALKGNDGNDPSATNPVEIAFRNSTATDSSFVVRQITSAISMTVDAGATLGFPATSYTGEVFVYAIDTGSGVVLGCSGLNHYSAFDESKVVSSTALDTSADSAHTLYSDAAQTSKPIRYLGKFTIQADAATLGNWSNAPTIIGCQEYLKSGVGEGQIWQDVSGSRSSGTTYQNTTGKPIMVSVTFLSNINFNGSGGVLKVGTADPPTITICTVYSESASNANPDSFQATAIVPNNHYYSATVSASGSITSWAELR